MTSRKVLLAEDDADDQKLFYDFLQHRHDIVIMSMLGDGVALFDFLESIKDQEGLPDLIILDQNMPKRNGLQTLQLLKSQPRYAPIPVMIYSTYTDQQLIQKSAEMGAAAIMSKPVTRNGYNEMMDAFLNAAYNLQNKNSF